MPGAGGGGGGGAPGAAVGGIGGGGGGAPLGAPDGMGGGGGGAAGAEVGGGEDGVSPAAAVGDLTGGGEEALSPAAERGRGGAMVPKRMEASWAALLPPVLSSSESSSESSSLSVPQSSSSCRFLDTGRDGRDGMAAPTALAADPAALETACVIRKKGFVDSGGAGAGGDATGAGGLVALVVDGASDACDIIRK